mgnify:FL=1
MWPFTPFFQAWPSEVLIGPQTPWTQVRAPELVQVARHRPSCTWRTSPARQAPPLKRQDAPHSAKIELPGGVGCPGARNRGLAHPAGAKTGLTPRFLHLNRVSGLYRATRRPAAGWWTAHFRQERTPWAFARRILRISEGSPGGPAASRSRACPNCLPSA